jgi:ATP-dependent RNA helicase RhlE
MGDILGITDFMTSFNDFGLSRPLTKALAATGYETPTPIQTQAIPLVMDGNDLMGLAQTGTGKTAAFTLPLLDKLLLSTERAAPCATRALILAPTRELASQIAKSVMEYGKFTPLRVATVVGGVPLHKQARKLKGGVDVLIATPGRLIDLEQQDLLDLSDTRFLVLDEADQMLDMGFIHPLRQISRMLPKKRQTLMFSATMPKAIQQLSKAFLTNPEHVSVAPTSTPADKIQQEALYVNAAEKQALLSLVLNKMPGERVIIFARTKRGADRMAKRLVSKGVEATAIHGDKSQGQRERALKQFKSNQVNVLVATDVAARGIDIPDVDHVINFDIPNVAEQYVHRIGRTARAGREGRATAFVSHAEIHDFRAIEKLMGIKVQRGELPEGLSDAAKEIAKDQQQNKPKRQNARSDQPTHNSKRQHSKAENSTAQGEKRQDERSEHSSDQRADTRQDGRPGKPKGRRPNRKPGGKRFGNSAQGKPAQGGKQRSGRPPRRKSA